VRALLAAGLTFFVTLVSPTIVEARARCAAGLYYRPTQGRCVSAQEYRRVMKQIGSKHSASGARARPKSSPSHRVAKGVESTPAATPSAIERQPSHTPGAPPRLAEKRTEETESSAPRPAPPPGSLLIEMLPRHLRLWEKQYPTQWD
jgi:hypothetical protein